MHQLAVEPWVYTLFEDGDRLILSAMVGGVGLYELPVVMNEAEVAAYRAEGAPALVALARTIRDDPQAFAARRVRLP
ncbi:hypothetical protein L6R49_02770 [Myxococcota bacterium]|nr:hypothetical protein [Myxococcota bacterium]